MPETTVRAGSADELRRDGRLITKVGHLPVVVFWDEGRAFAIEDRCPHMGFPLHQGTVESGLVTCHWHHARFDLESGCTLDLWADDAAAFDVAFDGDDVLVSTRADHDQVTHLQRRLRDGLEDGLTLVTAKSVLGLLAAGVPTRDIVQEGIEFGVRYRDAGWGAGLTVLVAMANLLPHLHEDDRALALVHGLAFVSRDTRNHPPRFSVGPLETDAVPNERLAEWYRRFVDTRTSDAAERVIETALSRDGGQRAVEGMMFAAVTDHVFIDGGHTIDFTNKAFEALEHVGAWAALDVLPTLVRQTAAASRSEEHGEWRHPHDLPRLINETVAELEKAAIEGAANEGRFDDVAGLAWQLLDDDPHVVVDALLDAIRAGAAPQEVGQAIAYAAGLRITRFHTQNDFGDWDTVHHAFTAANALHHALVRNPTPELQRGAVHAVLRIYLDRFMNVPAARLPQADHGELAELAECFEVQGRVDDAGNLAYGFLRAGGSRAELIAALGHALLGEDAEFHWFQVVEAGVRQALTWPDGSEESALLLAGLARFLSAHTPTRRELPTVVRIATRLRRGEALYEDA
ncbi:MAG: ferredoxin [Actinomycetia bacterium]|nr:ferredoxin [Actinomycetes bacterium]